MKIQILNYSAGSFTADMELWEKLNDKKSISMECVSRIRYYSTTDVCGMQFDFILTHEQAQVIRTGFLFGLKIENLNGLIGDSITKEENTRHIAEIVKFIWPYVVGAFAARCEDNGIQIILPAVDANKFAEEIILQKQTPK